MDYSASLDAMLAQSEQRVADLQGELDLELGFLDELRRKHAILHGNPVPVAKRSKRPRRTGELTMAARVQRILNDAAAPLAVDEIVSRLAVDGVVTPGQTPIALKTTCYCTLARRMDLFKRVERGMYQLADRAAAISSP